MSRDLIPLSQVDAEHKPLRFIFLWRVLGTPLGALDRWFLRKNRTIPLLILYLLLKLPHIFLRRLSTGSLLPSWTYANELSAALAQYVVRGDNNFRRRLINMLSKPVGKATANVVLVEEEGGDVKGYWITLPGVKPVTRLDGEGKSRTGQVPLTIFFIHGGGFSFGHPLMHQDALIHLLQTLSKIHHIAAQIFTPYYPLSPEHPFPTPHRSIEKIYTHITTSLDPSRIILAGDSAGATLVITLLQHLRDTSQTLPQGAILFSPFVNQNPTARSFRTNEAYDYLSRLQILQCAQTYLSLPSLPTPDASSLSHPAVSVINSRLTDFPPLFVTMGRKEVFVDDIRAFVGKCREGGTEVVVDEEGDMVHEWQLLVKLFGRRAKRGLDRVAKWVEEIVRE